MTLVGVHRSCKLTHTLTHMHVYAHVLFRTCFRLSKRTCATSASKCNMPPVTTSKRKKRYQECARHLILCHHRRRLWCALCTVSTNFPVEGTVPSVKWRKELHVNVPWLYKYTIRPLCHDQLQGTVTLHVYVRCVPLSLWCRYKTYMSKFILYGCWCHWNLYSPSVPLRTS